MHIVTKFRFRDEPEVAATTGVTGDVADLIIPCVGDIVWHHDASGMPFMGRVAERFYMYDLARGENIEGSVQVMILLDRISDLGHSFGQAN